MSLREYLKYQLTPKMILLNTLEFLGCGLLNLVISIVFITTLN